MLTEFHTIDEHLHALLDENIMDHQGTVLHDLWDAIAFYGAEPTRIEYHDGCVLVDYKLGNINYCTGFNCRVSPDLAPHITIVISNEQPADEVDYLDITRDTI